MLTERYIFLSFFVNVVKAHSQKKKIERISMKSNYLTPGYLGNTIAHPLTQFLGKDSRYISWRVKENIQLVFLSVKSLGKYLQCVISTMFSEYLNDYYVIKHIYKNPRRLKNSLKHDEVARFRLTQINHINPF